eukprot:scaffold60_cov137-Skeletonema_marinoi.AAC.21
MLTYFSNKSNQPLCSRRRRRKSTVDTSSSSSITRSSLSSINLILISAVLLLATVVHTASAGGSGGSERFKMMRQKMMPPSKLVKSSSAALFGLGNKRGSLLHPSSTRTAFSNNRSNRIDRRLLATSAGWRDRSTAAFITSSSSSLVPSFTTNGLKKHDNYQFQYSNNNLNFFSTAATSTTSTAIYATVPKAGEKHVKAATATPKAASLGHTNNNKANKQVPTYDYTTIHTIPLTTNFQIKSKPKDGGNWNPTSPLKWCQTFGSRSPEMQQHLSSIIQLKPGDEGYIPPEVYNKEEYPNVTIVRTKEQARIVLEALKKSKLTEPERIHACDTEVMDIDLKNVGPVGNGYVTCLSVYSGPDFDYGLNDQGPGTMLWVDNLDDACGILEEFKEWLEDETFFLVLIASKELPLLCCYVDVLLD